MGKGSGMLSMDIRRLSRSHIGAGDELGVVDPADNTPDHVALRDDVRSRIPGGVVFHEEWLAVRKSRSQAQRYLCISLDSCVGLRPRNGTGV